MWPFPMESVHPLVVHFPIALLLTALVLDLAAFVLRRPGIHRIALWNLTLGTLAAGVAVWTGLRAADVAKHTFEIHQVMELHRTLGISTLVLGSFAVAWRLWKRERLTGYARALTVVWMVCVAATLCYAAHLGGRLVYEFGVGGSFGRLNDSPVSTHHH